MVDSEPPTDTKNESEKMMTDEEAETEDKLVESLTTKVAIRRAYDRADIGLSAAIPALMNHDLNQGEALRYLGL